MKEREKPNLDHNKRLPSFQSEREDKKLRWKKSEQFSEVSEAHKINVEDTSSIKSRTRLMNMEEKSNISSDARVTWLQTDKRTT